MAEDLRQAIEKIRRDADLLAVVGRSVALRRAGSRWVGLCPFHQEKTGSFHVNPETGFFKCFGCGAGGDVFDFVMRTEKLEFMEALRLLAEEVGVELPKRGAGGPVGPDGNRIRALRAAMDFAQEWFRANLVHGRNALAVEYLGKRGVPPEVAEKFEIGAGVPGWTPLLDAAAAKGFSEGLLLEAGLASQTSRGSAIDRFRNRLMFPIRDHLGRLVGFGGRVLESGDDREAKYINSAETPLYSKGRHIYALSAARKEIEEAGSILLTEGYMDVVAAHQFGFGNAVASLGTALTPEQAKRLKHYANRVDFLYDGDAAGRKAMLGGGVALFGAGLDVRVIDLPAAHDPDTFLREEGPDSLRAMQAGAREYIDFALDELSSGLDLTKIADQTALVEKMAPIIRAAENEIVREAAISRLANRLANLPRAALARMVEAGIKAAPAPRRDEPAEGAPAPSPGAPAFDRLDASLLRLMLSSLEALEIARHGLEHSWLADPRLEPWILFLVDHDGDPEALLAEARLWPEPPGDFEALTRVLVEELPPIRDIDHAVEQILARMKRRAIAGGRAQLLQALQGGSGDPQARARLLKSVDSESRLFVRTPIPRTNKKIE